VREFYFAGGMQEWGTGAMLATEIRGMRKVVGCLVIALVASGCRGATTESAPLANRPLLQIRETPSPYTEVSAGSVQAFIPDRWHPWLAGDTSGAQRGLIASPRPRDWATSRQPVEGMAAVWVDGTEVGVPSDYYYLAATGPALTSLTGSPGCRATMSRVYANHRPAFAHGSPDSPGDYVALGQGVCTVRKTLTRWAYFVAAPGYGPIRRMGIPSSGLYLVVAVLPDTPRAPAMLNRLLLRTQFGGTTVSDIIAATRHHVVSLAAHA